MARKGRHIADFDEVASVESPAHEITDEVKVKENPITEVSIIKEEDKKIVEVVNARDDIEADIDTDELEVVVKRTNDENIDVIDDILNNNKTKSTRIQRGLYLDREIDKVLNTLFKKGGKGSKSDILNSVLRKEFKSKGLL